MDAPKKERRRVDGAHKKAHLRTVENPRRLTGAPFDSHLLFLVENVLGIRFRQDAIDIIFWVDGHDFVNTSAGVGDAAGPNLDYDHEECFEIN